MTTNERNQLAIRRLKAFQLQLFSLIDCVLSQVPPLFWFSFVLCTFLSSPRWVWVARQCCFIYRLNSAATVLYTRQAEIHNLRHKTMAAGRLLLASCTPLRSVILAALKEKLCSRTYSITRSLALPLPPENWISTVVLCDVPVPDKSLTSPCACI